MSARKRVLSLLCGAALLLGNAYGAEQPVTSSGMVAGGWFESLYAEIANVTDNDVTAVSYSGASSGSLSGDDFTYLVRDGDGVVRIDIPGLIPGTYSLTVETAAKTYTATGITVMAYDRSGYAHFNYTDGVGAYQNDGALKENAVVLYVTSENKNTVTLTYGGKTATGIGNILNTDAGKSNGVLGAMAKDGVALAVRLVGDVVCNFDTAQPNYYDIQGLTGWATEKAESALASASELNGGSAGDAGAMARIKQGKNITVEGVGADSGMNGWGLHFVRNNDSYGTGFEVRNLSFHNVPEDCVGMEGNGDNMTCPVERCWVHNCAFYAPSIPSERDPSSEGDKGGGDGACDFKRGQYMTMSYCYFEGYHKTNLVGSSETVQQYNITWHHNWWKNCDSRGPLGRQANMHIYNNVYEGQTSYCMSLRTNCFIFAEYNLFKSCKNPVVDEDKGGVCKSYQNTFDSCTGTNNATVVESKSATVSSACTYANFDTDPTVYVAQGDYSLDENVTLAQENVQAYAGPMKAAAEIPVPDHTHDWSDWEVTTPATCTQPGQETQTCQAEDCPIGTNTRTLPALGHSYVDNVCTRCGHSLAGTTYEFTGDDVFTYLSSHSVTNIGGPGTDSSNPNSYVASNSGSFSAGDEDYFTLLFTNKTRFDPSAKTFDETDIDHRINFYGAATTSSNAVQFTTSGPAQVTVWWVGAVSTTEVSESKPFRPMVILDETGTEVALSVLPSDNSTPMISTLYLPKAGTYFLGGKGGKNFLFKVSVTLQAAPALSGELGTLFWGLDEGALTIMGAIPAGHTVYAACYDESDLLVDVKLLSSGTPSLPLGTDFHYARLFWVDGQQRPQCVPARVEPDG